MEAKESAPSIQELARQMVKTLEAEAASDPDGMLAAHIAMSREIAAVPNNSQVGGDTEEDED